MGLKKLLVNFGIDMVLNKMLNILVEQRKPIITKIEDEMIRLVNKADLDVVTELATEPADKQVLMDAATNVKDKGVLFIRQIITLIYYLVLFLLKSNLRKIMEKVRI